MTIFVYIYDFAMAFRPATLLMCFRIKMIGELISILVIGYICLMVPSLGSIAPPPGSGGIYRAEILIKVGYFTIRGFCHNLGFLFLVGCLERPGPCFPGSGILHPGRRGVVVVDSSAYGVIDDITLGMHKAEVTGVGRVPSGKPLSLLSIRSLISQITRSPPACCLSCGPPFFQWRFIGMPRG